MAAKKKKIIFLLYSWVLFSERVEILPQQKQRIDGFLKKNNHVQLKDLLECWNVRWDKGGVTQIKTERLIFQVTKKKKKKKLREMFLGIKGKKLKYSKTFKISGLKPKQKGRAK